MVNIISDKFFLYNIYIYIYMSFTQSLANCATKDNYYPAYIYMSGNAIASSYISGLWYSSNYGQTYTQSNVTLNPYQVVYMVGTNAIAGSSNNKGLMFSRNLGQIWIQSNITTGTINTVYMVGTNAIASSTLGVYYSSDSGNTWTLSNYNDSSGNTIIKSNYIDSSGNAIVGSNYMDSSGNAIVIFNNQGLWYSTNFGKIWTPSNTNTSSITSISLQKTNAIAISNVYGLLYSSDTGKTWNQSDASGNKFNCISMDTSGNAIAGYNNSIWYSSNYGYNWVQSTSTITTNITSVYIIGLNAVACSNTTLSSILYSSNSGKNWYGSSYIYSSFNSIYMMNQYVVASSNSGWGAWYSSDYGINWSNSLKTTANLSSVSMSGTNAIACSEQNIGLLYSLDSGITWSQSAKIDSSFGCVYIVGNNAVAGDTWGNGLWYSSDSGQTWTVSSKTNGTYRCIYMVGTNVIAGAYETGLWYSSNSGVNWIQTNCNPTGTFSSVYMVGANAIACSNSGLWYSSTSGSSWSQSNKINDYFISVFMDSSGNAIAGNASWTGLWYSKDYGKTWSQSTKTDTSFRSVYMVGAYAIAGSSSNIGLWYSSNYGVSWTQSNKTNDSFTSVYMVETQALAGSNSNGLWYSSNSGKTWMQSNLKNYSIRSIFMNLNGNNIVVGNNIIAYLNNKNASYLNIPRIDPSGSVYTGYTISNNAVISKFNVFSRVLPINIVQVMAQYNTNTWTAVYYTTLNNSEYLELLTVDAYGNPLDALVVQTDTTSNAMGIITNATKTYNVFDIDNEIITQINKYSITYQTSTITQITGTNPIGKDSSGNTIYGFVLDASGNPNYNITYNYILNKYKLDTSLNWILDASGSTTLISTSYSTINQSLYIPFKNFIFNDTQLLNFDMFFKLNMANNSTYQIIKVTNFDNSPKYLTITVDTSGNSIFQPKALKLSQIDTFYYDVSGNLLDTSGNIINPNSLSTTTSGGYLVFNNNAMNSAATLQVFNPQSNTWVTTPVMIYNYGYLDYKINPVTGALEVDGPVIIQLSTVVVEVDDTVVDSCCMQINNMITEISKSTFKIGKLEDYQSLITEVNAYTSNLNAAKISLNIDQASSLEAYAANIQSMTNLFGQLLIQLNSASLVDSENICIRIKTALSAIYEGLQAMKSFKLAISQQNLLKVSQCLLGMSSKLNLLYGSVTFSTVYIVNSYPIIYVVNSSSFGPLFNLHESIWYFANGLPSATMVKTGSDGLTYYQTWSSPSYWVQSSYYTSNFALNTNDASDLTSAYTLVHTLNLNAGDNINAVLASPDVKDLQNSLGQFSQYSNNLNNARNNLIYKLGSIGFKMTFDPRFN